MLQPRNLSHQARFSGACGSADRPGAGAGVVARAPAPPRPKRPRLGTRSSCAAAAEDIEDDLRSTSGTSSAKSSQRRRGAVSRAGSAECASASTISRRSAAQYIVDRISSLALDVGLEPGEPGCRPDVNIVFATNARETASADGRERTAGLHARGRTRRHGSRPRGARGVRRVREGRALVARELARRRTHRRGCHRARQAVRAGTLSAERPVAGPSRIHNGTRDDLMYVIIIVDATKLKGTTWQQLGDYLAVVSLAQIDPKTNPAAFDSILNLFSNPAAYSGLTDWDRSYVRALYEFDQERIASAQANEIVSRIAEQELEARRVATGHASASDAQARLSHQARQTVLNAASRSRANCGASMTGDDSSATPKLARATPPVHPHHGSTRPRARRTAPRFAQRGARDRRWKAASSPLARRRCGPRG